MGILEDAFGKSPMTAQQAAMGQQLSPLLGSLGSLGQFTPQQLVPVAPQQTWDDFRSRCIAPNKQISFYDKLRNEIDEWLKL